MPPNGSPSTERLTLVKRVRDLIHDLDVAEAGLAAIEHSLLRRVRVRVATHLAVKHREARDLLRTAEEGSGSAADVWAQVNAHREEVDQLLEECLLLINGSVARAAKVDDGFCEVADALVDELVARTPVGHWSSYTVIGGSDHYTRGSRVIQVRFPTTSVWELATVAHELGHFVGPTLVEEVGIRSEHPLDTLFDEYGDGDERSWSWLQELFADAFATHMLGPAYGFNCVLAGFDPLLSLYPTDSHPPVQQRVDIMSMMLKARDDDDFAWAADRLTELWKNLVAESEGAEGRAPVGKSPFAAPIVRLIDDQLPISGYEGWPAANEIAARLTKEKVGPPDGMSRLSDVLNGAWLARLQSESLAAVDRVGRDALEWCRVAIREVT